MGESNTPRGKLPIRIPPIPKRSKPTIGEQKAAALGQTAEQQAALAKNRKIILISVSSVTVALLISIIVCIWYFFGWPTNDGLILNNVMVGGINLGGMTAEEARTTLHEATDHTFTQMDMVIELPDRTMTLSPDKTGAKLDVNAAVNAAFHYGRIGSYKEREAIKEASLVSTHHIPLLNYLSLDLEYIKGELQAYGDGYNSVYRPSKVEFDVEAPVLDVADENFRYDAPCQTMTLTIGTPGRDLDIEKVYNQVLDAYSFNQFHVETKLEQPEQLPEPLDVEALHKEYRKEPVSARLNDETYEVIPEVFGYDFDLNNALQQMEQAKYGDTIEIPFRYLLPELYGSDLSALLFRDVLGAYETQHTAIENRNTNLRLACAAIDGLILGAGETFDFNTVVGERTADKGYKYAAAYSGGETVMSLGGGICQVSSTLYYCTLVADLEIVQRSPHSYVSSYMPMGTDATVSWGGPHFSFKNNTNYPIRIEAKVEDGYVKVKLIGTDEKNYYVVMDEPEILGSYYPKVIYEEYYPDNPQGYKDGQVLVTPYRGYSVRTYKLKYHKETGILLSREEDQVSVYKKRDEVVVKIVPRPAPPPAPEDPAPADPAPGE